MSCWCGAEYDDEGECPRCGGFTLGALDSCKETPLGLFDLPPFELPNLPFPDVIESTLSDLPDGPDELLSELAEMEAVVARERQALDESGGARRCRFCRQQVPPGPDSGVHDECWPRDLPEGARSCSACGECILDDDDDYEHDFCPLPGESTSEAGQWLYGDEEDGPTEPMPSAPPLRHEGSIQCACSRWLPLSLVAPLDAVEHCAESTASLICNCALRVHVTYSWARQCTTRIVFERPARVLN